MLKRQSAFVLILLFFSLLTACSIQKQVSAGISRNSGSVLSQATAENLISQSVQAVLPSATSAMLLITPEPVIIQSPAPSQGSPESALQPTPTCTNRAELIKQLNMLTNTALDPGQAFAKVWRIKNTGTCIWTADYALVFYSGEQMGGQLSNPLLSIVQPGEIIDLRVDLVAPLEQDAFSSNWVLQDANGNFFGVGDQADQSFSVLIQVKPTPMPTSG